MLPNNQKGIALLVVLFFVFSIAVTGILGYKFGKNKDQEKVPIAKSSPSPSVKVVVGGNRQLDSSTLPEINTIYFGENEGEDAVFITNEKLQKYFENGVQKSSQTVGQLRTQSSGESPYDFKNLAKPKKLVNIKGQVEQVINFKVLEGNLLYISLVVKTASSLAYPDNLKNMVLKINLDDLSNEEIWSFDFSTGKYGNAKGAAGIEKVSTDGSLLVLNLLECYACEPKVAGQIILNSKSKNEKYLEDIGNVLFQLNEEKFTYQKLESQEETCNQAIGCDNGKRTVLKPSGETFSENLPD